MTYPPPRPTLIDKLEIHIPLADLIDKNAEIARLTKEIEKLNQDIQKSSNKLDNPNYRNKAPQDVVAREEQRLNQNQLTLEKLNTQLKNIEGVKS